MGIASKLAAKAAREAAARAAAKAAARAAAKAKLAVNPKPKAPAPEMTVTPKAKSKPPSLLSAVRVGGKTYTGPTHLDALDAIPDPTVRSKATLDANSRGFVTERGKYLDRFKAADYARNFDLFAPDAPDWAKTAPEVISENLRLPELAVKSSDQGALSAVERAANLRAANPLLDLEGNPMRLYHGTRDAISAFDRDKIQSRFPYSFGFHLTDDPREASGYADDIQNLAVDFDPNAPFGRPVQEGANVMPLYAFPRNPLVIDTKNISASVEADTNRYDIARRIMESRKTDNPYDSVVIRRNKDDGYDHTNVIMLDPERIKSAIGNQGVYDLSVPDLKKARGGLAVKHQRPSPFASASNAA